MRNHSFFGPYLHFSKNFNWYTQEINQLDSFFCSISHGVKFSPVPFAFDIHIKDTMSISTFFDFNSNEMNIFYNESKEFHLFHLRNSQHKRQYPFLSFELIISTTYILWNREPHYNLVLTILECLIFCR